MARLLGLFRVLLLLHLFCLLFLGRLGGGGLRCGQALWHTSSISQEDLLGGIHSDQGGLEGLPSGRLILLHFLHEFLDELDEEILLFLGNCQLGGQLLVSVERCRESEGHFSIQNESTVAHQSLLEVWRGQKTMIDGHAQVRFVHYNSNYNFAYQIPFSSSFSAYFSGNFLILLTFILFRRLSLQFVLFFPLQSYGSL